MLVILLTCEAAQYSEFRAERQDLQDCLFSGNEISANQSSEGLCSYAPCGVYARPNVSNAPRAMPLSISKCWQTTELTLSSLGYIISIATFVLRVEWRARHSTGPLQSFRARV